eukprot:1425302-Pyramimonas_sp.AAC.1
MSSIREPHIYSSEWYCPRQRMRIQSAPGCPGGPGVSLPGLEHPSRQQSVGCCPLPAFFYRSGASRTVSHDRLRSLVQDPYLLGWIRR